MLLRPAAGTTRADGETVGFETEGTAIYDTMCFVKNEVGGWVGRTAGLHGWTVSLGEVWRSRPG
jgi:hypothetical protein